MYSVPSWQSYAGVPAASGSTGGRGVPDVAGNADPQTGYQVLVDGKQAVYGGTSAVAPLWAALIARLAQATGHQFGLSSRSSTVAWPRARMCPGSTTSPAATTVPTRRAQAGMPAPGSAPRPPPTCWPG